MNKKAILLFLVFFTAVAAYSQQQIPKIGIVNYSKILSNYTPDSSAFDEVEKLVKNYESGVESIKKDIDSLEERKLHYLNSGDETGAARIDAQIESKKNYLNQYSKTRLENIEKKRAGVLNSSAFLSDILKEIKYVAESEGYSVIFDSKDKNIIWWSQSVDITEVVLKRLQK